MDILISIYIFIIGMLLASFYGVIAMRIPHKESINGRSYCPKCNHQLRWIDIIPLLGYLINRGKCHFCKSKIPVIYLVIEIIGGALFLGSYLIFGFKLEFLVSIIFISVMLIETISDLEEMIVIDRIWMIGIIPLIIIRFIQSQIIPYLISSLLMFSLLFLISNLGSKILKKEALGGGDIKLYVFLGFVLTWQQALLSLFLASFFGMIYGFIRKGEERALPLVPFIFIGSIISYLWGFEMIDWYLSLLRM